MTTMDSESACRVVREVLQGRVDRFAVLVRGFETPIYNLALRMTGSWADAADLTQETFLRAWLNLDKYDHEQKFFTWLYTLSLNLARNHIKKNKHAASDVQFDPLRPPVDESFGVNPWPALTAKRDQEEVLALLAKLSVDHREALLLRFFQDISFADMAVILGVGPSAAKMRVRRGLQTLRKLLTAD